LYVVGLFDTYHACEVLAYEARSLAYLLKRYANFDADKKYQLADWRIRPLPEEMFYYARSDTHFLLYIFDMVRNDLVEKSDRTFPERDLIGKVLERSKETSLLRYENGLSDPETGYGTKGWYNAITNPRSPMVLNPEQFAVFKALHQWRDDTARRQDESTAFIMPQQTLVQLAKLLPPDLKAFHSVIGHTSAAAKAAANEVFALIQDAKARGVNGPSSMDILRAQNSQSLGAVAGKLGFGSSSATNGNVKENGEEATLPDIDELRLGNSQLFGRIPVISKWEGNDQSR